MVAHAFLAAAVLSCTAASFASAAADYDVIVYGATPGGVAAAVAAAREGRRVALLEPGLYIGGAMSGGLGLADYGPHARRVTGEASLSAEFFKRVAAHYGTAFWWPSDSQCGAHSVPWVSEPHVAEGVLRDMLRNASVTVHQGVRISTVDVHTNTIRSVVTVPDGVVYTAAVFIDATYEGALMKMARVTYTFGREANTTYNETAAGRLPTLLEAAVWPVPLVARI